MKLTDGHQNERIKGYQHELADIISMVHHAAEDDPLMSAEERVDRAIARVLGERSLTPDQAKWMELIRRHLATNLVIEQDDFTLLDFENQGATWKRVNADFDGALADLLLRLNEAVAG